MGKGSKLGSGGTNRIVIVPERDRLPSSSQPIVEDYQSRRVLMNLRALFVLVGIGTDSACCFVLLMVAIKRPQILRELCNML